MYTDDEFHPRLDREGSFDTRPLLSFGEIANYIAQCASLALTLQMTSLYQHDIRHVYPERISLQVPRQFSAITAATSNFFELAKRGIMVERELLEIDEVDLGWMISEMNSTVRNWVRGGPRLFGLSFLFAPLLVSAGYELSTVSKLPSDINDMSFKTTIDDILNNTTPEDTVNILQMIYDFQIKDPQFSDQSELVLNETIENMLDNEINLLSYFKLNSSHNILYNEAASNYPITFGEGWKAFSEAWNVSSNFSLSINHTYFTIMSLFSDHTLKVRSNKLADNTRRRAKELVDLGGFITEEGRKEAYALDRYLLENEIRPRSVSDLTSAVTFLGILRGFRP